MKTGPKQICIISAQADSGRVAEWVRRFRPLEDRQALSCWHSGGVKPGDSTETSLLDFLPQADAVLLWIGPELWEDDGLYRFFRQHQHLLSPQAALIPVLARPAVWTSDDFLQAQADALLPSDHQAMPTDDAAHRDAWFSRLAQEVAAAIGLTLPRAGAGRVLGLNRAVWKWALPGVALLIAVLAYLYWSGAMLRQPSSDALSRPMPTANACGFPTTFDSTHLYVLIARFEDYANDHETECYGRSIESRIDMVKLRESLPLRICYLDSLSPNQSEEADRLRDRYRADLIIWGKLRNAGPSCRADGLCLNFQPSDTLIRYAGGQVGRKVDNEYQPNIAAADLEAGLISMGPENFDAWLIGLCNLKIGRRKPEFYRIAADWPAARRAQEFLNRAELFYAFQNFEQAIADCDQALQIDPDYADAYNNRGVARNNLGQYAAAIADYDQALRLNPNYAYAYNNRGWARRNLGRPADAIADYDQALRLSPNYAYAYNNRGLSNHDLGRYAAAIADYDQALRLDSNFVFAYNNRGQAYNSAGNYQAALADCNRAIALDPNYTYAYNNRGNAKSQLGQYEAALDDYDQALWLDPRYAFGYNNRGLVRHALGVRSRPRRLRPGPATRSGLCGGLPSPWFGQKPAGPV